MITLHISNISGIIVTRCKVTHFQPICKQFGEIGHDERHWTVRIRFLDYRRSADSRHFYRHTVSLKQGRMNLPLLYERWLEEIQSGVENRPFLCWNIRGWEWQLKWPPSKKFTLKTLNGSGKRTADTRTGHCITKLTAARSGKRYFSGSSFGSATAGTLYQKKI